MSMTENEIITAFKNQNEINLRKIHLFLNESYHNIIFNQEEKCTLGALEIKRLKYMESVWIEFEKSEIMNRYDCNKRIRCKEDIQIALSEHPVFNHAYFNYLSQAGTLTDLKNYLMSDSVLNLEFFDYLALSIIGVADHAKAEIVTNMWDEAGRGCVEKFHTVTFQKILTGFDLQYKREDVIDQLSWEGLAGINLFSYMSLYSYNKMKYFGVLAATELLDPPHYHQVIKCITRLRMKSKVDKSYYTEHEVIDVEHANGWIDNVILPELSRRPDKLNEFWLGFYMRLDSAHRYYDHLYRQTMKEQAA